MTTTTLGKYNLLQKIGQGAMGDVFKAQDGVLGRTVAVKTIGGGIGFQPDEEAVNLLRREARSAASLNHPNIVTVHDFDEKDGTFFLVMELLDGTDLKEAHRRQLLPELGQKLDVMLQISAAMAYAHSCKVVHRDLKPANIRLLPDGTVKIMDFGLARLSQTEMTRSGRVIGTPQYMSPEQVQGQLVDARSDVFSLGILFYELLSGRRPFPAPEVHAVLFQILQRQPEPLRSYGPHLAVFDPVVGKAMEKDPQLRYPDAGAVYEALSQIAPERLAVASPPTRPRRFRTPSSSGSGSGAGVGSTARSSPDSSSGSVSSTAATHISSTVTFLGERSGDIEVLVTSAKMSLLDASLAQGIPHFHECGGRGRCSTCRVRVIDGGENLVSRTPQEEKLARRLGWSDDIRLACQARMRGDVRIQRLILDDDDVGLLFGERTQEMGAQEIALAIMSCELLDFASWILRAPPYDAIHVLNRFYLQVGEPILANGGRIQSYTGAGLLALFGLEGETARTKCVDAVRAALRIEARMASFNQYLRSYFSTELRLGIGLHFARLIVGQLGHPSKMELSAIGGAGTYTQHLCHRNLANDTVILATEELINIVEDDLQVGRILPDEEVVSGRRATLYEITELAQPDAVFMVQTSFERIEARRDEASKIFYELLFEIDPGIEPLFEEVDLKVQGEMLMAALSAAVKGLDDFDTLCSSLRELGERHLAYGTELHHYDAVEQALLEMVQRILGEEFNLDVRLAWAQIYSRIVSAMTETLPAGPVM